MLRIFTNFILVPPQVLQELYLATNISCYCGMDSRPFDNIMAISLLMDFWINEDSHALHWTFITRRFVSFLARRSWLLRRQKSCKALQSEWAAIQPQRGCQTLASGAWGPRRLAEVLNAMQHFHCTDVRDRLYGVLSLVDWCGTAIPTPDYDKDRFEVAVEVLQRYLDERQCAPLSEAVVDWAHQLWGVFDVSSQDKALQEAVRVRCLPSIIPHAIRSFSASLGVNIYEAQTSYTRLSRPSLQLTEERRIPSKLKMANIWYGMQLRLANASSLTTSFTETMYLFYTAPATSGRLGKILDQYGRLIAYAPSDTRVGDWLLQNSKPSRTERVPIAMIVRPSKSKDYTIVGQACIDDGYVTELAQSLDFKHFQPHWDPEDLLLLYWSYTSRMSTPQLHDTIADWLELRICGSKDSSYFEPASIPTFERRVATGYAQPISSFVSGSLAVSAITPLLGKVDSDSDSDSD